MELSGIVGQGKVSIMRRLARRFFLTLCMLALIGGGTVSLAASVTAAHPCVHAHGEPGDTLPPHHDHHGAGCLACCFGACAAVANLPVPGFGIVTGFAAAPVTYWEANAALSGRSIAPDPAPPRTAA